MERSRLRALAWPAAMLALSTSATPTRAQTPAPAAPATARPGSSANQATRSHLPFGPVRPPVPLPALRMLGDDGPAFALPARLTGRVTLMQLMFTGCSATCPIQGAVFAGVVPRLQPGTQLLSVSIDALNDDPKALRGWLARFPTHPNWRAAVPARVADVDVLFDLLGARSGSADPHTSNVYLIDRQARLIFKTAEMPPAEELVALLGQALRLT